MQSSADQPYGACTCTHWPSHCHELQTYTELLIYKQKWSALAHWLAYTYQLNVINYMFIQNYSYMFKQRRGALAQSSFPLRSYLLPDSNICLLVGFKDTSSVVSTGSSWESLLFILILLLWCFKLSLEECIEFTILGLNTIVVHGLFSFHHLEKFGQHLRQRLQQQQ